MNPSIERLIGDKRVVAIAHDRIIAVEMFRGPDHIATRSVAFSMNGYLVLPHSDERYARTPANRFFAF